MVRQPYSFGFGVDDLLTMVGLHKSFGRPAITKLLESKELTVVDNKLFTNDITRIYKSAVYYKKMETRRESWQTNEK